MSCTGELLPFTLPAMKKPTVIDALRMHRDDPNAIIAAGELVDMRFVNGNALSLRAAKLFCLLIQEAGVAVVENRQHRLPYSVLNETFHASRDVLAEAVLELHTTTISVELVDTDGRAFTKSGPILSDVEREADTLLDAEIRFEFSPALRRVIASSTHWAAISRRAVMAFESKYALRLYMWLSLRAGLRKVSEDVPLDELRAMMGLSPSKLVRWQDFSRYALDPAIAEINHLAGFRAAYEPIKRGRGFVGVRFAWGTKGRAELAETYRELERPRVGRVARREGLVESIADERRRLADGLAGAGQALHGKLDHPLQGEG